MRTRALSRRDFLKRAAAAVAAPTIVPSSVFARPAPSDRVALAAIGVGNRGGGNVWADFVTTQDDVRDRGRLRLLRRPAQRFRGQGE